MRPTLKPCTPAPGSDRPAADPPAPHPYARLCTRKGRHIALPAGDELRLGNSKAGGERLHGNGTGVEPHRLVCAPSRGHRAVERDDLCLAVEIDQMTYRKPGGGVERRNRRLRRIEIG